MERTMTPQERQLVSELFDRLEKLEGERRDPDAERLIFDGFQRAPNAAYALVQTVLVQEEALKRANARIEELEAALAGDGPQPQSGGFLGSMRDSLLGREQGRGSVPTVHPGGGMGTSGVWNTGARYDNPAPARGYYDQPPMTSSSAPGGGSFLGTAAAGAAGVIGGALLLNSIRGMFGPSHSGQASSAFDPGLSGERTPWGGNAANSDLARDAGLSDIGGGGRTASSDEDRRAGLFGGDDSRDSDDSDDDDDDDSNDVAGDFDDGGSDTA
jgi:uncharacterized protein